MLANAFGRVSKKLVGPIKSNKKPKSGKGKNDDTDNDEEADAAKDNGNDEDDNDKYNNNDDDDKELDDDKDDVLDSDVEIMCQNSMLAKEVNQGRKLDGGKLTKQNTDN